MRFNTNQSDGVDEELEKINFRQLEQMIALSLKESEEEEKEAKRAVGLRDKVVKFINTDDLDGTILQSKILNQ
jgi:hypothetical protein